MKILIADDHGIVRQGLKVLSDLKEYPRKLKKPAGRILQRLLMRFLTESLVWTRKSELIRLFEQRLRF